jgi:hypothetical protein
MWGLKVLDLAFAQVDEWGTPKRPPIGSKFARRLQTSGSHSPESRGRRLHLTATRPRDKSRPLASRLPVAWSTRGEVMSDRWRELELGGREFVVDG